MNKYFRVVIIFQVIFGAIMYGQPNVKLESAAACGECHQDIYLQWSQSRHARSTPSKNILFAKVYELSQKDTHGETKLYCIRCHAPVTQLNGDVDLLQEITNEGITCDICHSVTALTDSPEHWPNLYDPGRVVRGPHKDAAVEEHEVIYSGLFENSRLCSGCHGDMLDIPGTRSCGNLTICDTDFEWRKTASAKEGISCVSCHMTLEIAEPGEKVVHQHDFTGAYSPATLQKAVKLSLDVNEFAGEAITNVEIVNHGVAHLLPTGPPARMIFLKVTALDQNGQSVWSNFSDNPAKQDPFGVFHIVFANREGKVPAMPWLASRIAKDTRLRPGETRRLIYKFPAQAVERVEAKLFYRLAPPPLLDKFEIEDKILRKAYLMARAEKSLQ